MTKADLINEIKNIEDTLERHRELFLTKPNSKYFGNSKYSVKSSDLRIAISLATDAMFKIAKIQSEYLVEEENTMASGIHWQIVRMMANRVRHLTNREVVNKIKDGTYSPMFIKSDIDRLNKKRSTKVYLEGRIPFKLDYEFMKRMNKMFYKKVGGFGVMMLCLSELKLMINA